MARDFSVIVNPYLWKQLKENDDKNLNLYQIHTKQFLKEKYTWHDPKS